MSDSLFPDAAPAPESLILKYRGALEDSGQMDGEALATALSGLVSLVDQANATGLFGDHTRAKVVVKAHREGSFEIVAALVWVVEHGVQIGALTGGVGALLGGVRKTVERFSKCKPVGVEPGMEPGYVVVKWSDGSISEHTSEEWRFMNSKRARRAVRQVGAPGGSEGGTRSLEMRTLHRTESIDAKDAAAVPDVEESETDVEVGIYEGAATPATIDFDPKRDWWINVDGKRRRVTLEDERFLADVACGAIKIGKTDRLHVRMRIEVWRNADGSNRTQRILERVEVVNAQEQPRLLEGE